MIGKKESRVEFVGYLITVLLGNKELYSDEVLFRDAVEEIYRTLKEEVLDGGRKELAEAYEKAVVLRALVSGGVRDPEGLLLEIKRELMR